MFRIPKFYIIIVFTGALIIHGCKKEVMIPVLNTVLVYDISFTSAKSGGIISDYGKAAVSERGVCWSTSEHPTRADNFTIDEGGSDNFRSVMEGLTPRSVYYVRSYATNAAGTGYGEELRFETPSYKLAELITSEVSEVTLTTAKAGGSITDDGGSEITARGICLSIQENPTIADTVTLDGTGISSFVSSLTGLVPGTTYYLRAYATNIAGIAYGNQISFQTSAIAVPTVNTTEISGITLNTAISGGNITNDGGGVVTERGVCWSTSPNPSITGDKRTNGSGPGIFISSLTGLVPGTTYYLRAFATNSAGTGYGNEIDFITLTESLPTVTTSPVTEISSGSARSGGNISDNGGGAITARGVCWSTAHEPTTASNKTIDSDGSGSFISNITALNDSTTYYVRAYATNNAGTVYGNEIAFITLPVSLPTVTTAPVTEISSGSAMSGGNISDNGGGTITARGICWSTAHEPTTASNKTMDGDGSGSFISNITALNDGTTYYVRAYAINSAGTSYGNEVEFRTITVEAWMLSPYFALPHTGLALMAGQEVTFYGDALINVPIVNNLEVTYNCDIGTASGNNYIINPSSENAGDHIITMTFRNNGALITTENITFTVYNKESGIKKILLIGDSTMPTDVQQAKIVSILNSSTIQFLGTVGIAFKNEGYPGSSWNGFITGTHGKFYASGALKVPAYFTTYSIETPDYVYIRLGINDTFSFCKIGNAPITDAAITTILNRAKTLTDAFLNFNPNLKVILGLPTLTENSGAGWANNYDETSYIQDLFIEQMHRYRKSLVETFANGSYNPRVDCSYDAIFLDRDEGYPKAGGIHNNGVHPDQSGFEQLATGMALIFNKLINVE